MKLLIKIFMLCSLMAAIASCSKKDNVDGALPASLGGDTWAKGPIDKWLYDSLTKPYNIEVKYRWDPWEVHLDKTLVPPDESKVIPAMSAVRQIWIEPYSQVTGSDLFIKKFAPKEFVLIGSPEYNYNGTILLGQAEGGNRIELFVINNFDKSNINELRRMLHTIEHEFAHILHQNVLYPTEYKGITSGYTATWFNITDAEAREMGFITSYSMAGPDEDFVEMVATMLVEGKTRYEEIVASISSADARAALRKKEEIVVNYFRQVWNIDFYNLQQKTQDALNKIAGPPPPVANYLGFGKDYTTVSVDPTATSLLPLPAAFLSVYNSAKTGLAGVGGYGLVMDSIAVEFNSATTMIFRIYMHNGAGDYEANFLYNVSIDANGIYKFTLAGADGNGNLIASGVKPLLDYFSNNTFRVDWFINPNNTIKWRAIFTPQQNSNAYFIGLMLP